jgi:hypothetical protein
MIYPKIAFALGMASAITLPKLAFAHLGHVGDIAGHGHLIGLAGLAAAGAGAIVLGILRGGKTKADDEAEGEVDTAGADKDAVSVTDGGAEVAPKAS